MLPSTRFAAESARPMDVAIVVVYSVLSFAWLAINPLRAQSVEQDGTTWYLQTHLCALGKQTDCDERVASSRVLMPQGQFSTFLVGTCAHTVQ